MKIFQNIFKTYPKKYIFLHLYYYSYYYSSKNIKLIKKNNIIITSINEDQSGSNSDINELCKSEKEFDNINEIKEFYDSGNENYTYRKRKKKRIISDIEK